MTPAHRAPRIISHNDTPTTRRTITPTRTAPHRHKRSQSYRWNLTLLPSPTNAHRPETPDPPGPSLQTLRDAPEEPSQAPKTEAAHLTLHLPERPSVPQASEEAELFPRGPLGNVVSTRIRLVKMAPVSPVSRYRIFYAKPTALLRSPSRSQEPLRSRLRLGMRLPSHADPTP